MALVSRDVTLKGALGFLSGLFISFFLMHRSGPRESSGISERTQLRQSALKTDIFSLLVSVKFNQLDGIVAFKKIFSPYAQWVSEEEPSTLSYQLLQHDSKPLEVLVLERYQNKDAYLNVHRKSPEFLKFKESFLKLQDSNSTGFEISGNSYNDIPAGFVQW